MGSLLTIALVAVAAILGFFAYRSSQKGNAVQADLAAKTEAVTALEAEKTKLTDDMAKLKAEGEAAAKAASDAAAAVEAEAKGLLDKVTALEADKTKLTKWPRPWRANAPACRKRSWRWRPKRPG